jgi:ribose transport system permease protein
MSSMPATDSLARNGLKALDHQRWLAAIGRGYNRWGAAIALAVVLAIGWTADNTLFGWGSLRYLLAQNAGLGVVAVGMTFVIIVGGIDISVGSVFALGACVYARMSMHTSLVLAGLVALPLCCAAGLVNGLLVTKGRLNPFVVTLGTASLYGGAAWLYAGNDAIVPTNAAFGSLGTGQLGSVPYADIALASVFVLGAAGLHRSIAGKLVFAVGGNATAATLNGVRADAVRIGAYVLSGLCAGFAGILGASQTGVALASMGGTNIALMSIAIVVIGGTSLLGGSGAMWRTLCGFLVIATINDLFNVLGITIAVQNIVEAAVLIPALMLDALTRRTES